MMNCCQPCKVEDTLKQSGGKEAATESVARTKLFAKPSGKEQQESEKSVDMSWQILEWLWQEQTIEVWEGGIRQETGLLCILGQPSKGHENTSLKMCTAIVSCLIKEEELE